MYFLRIDNDDFVPVRRSATLRDVKIKVINTNFGEEGDGRILKTRALGWLSITGARRTLF